MFAKLRHHKIALWLFALLAACGVAIAVSDLAGQANKTCADAGINGADMEIASLDTIKQSESNPVDWTQERNLRKKIDAVNSKYMTLANKARSELDATGEVTAPTRDAGLACAQDYKAASENYAQFWDNNNGPTRARLAREAGEARVKNADMTFNKIDSDKINAYNDQMDKLTEARQAYIAEAKNDVSEEDKAAMKADLTPRLNSLYSNFMTIINTITSLLDQVKAQLGGGDIGGLVSCSRAALDSGNPVTSLMSPLTNLMSLVKSLAGDVQSLSSDLAALEE